MYTSNINIINEADFKEVVNYVFDKVATVLSRSLGPYGSTTIIEKFGDIHITKDGWQILKKLCFDDQKASTILNLLVKISSQVVVNVGDGSTSSIVAANHIFTGLNNETKLKYMRPKEIVDRLDEVVKNIVEYIQSNATMIDSENDENWSQNINKVALVSTNDNKMIADIIEDIYKKTKNPTIEFVTSKDNETTHSIVRGYKLKNSAMLDRVYINDELTNKCTVKKPMVLLFTSTVDIQTGFEFIQRALEISRPSGRRLIVLAPYYDRFVLNQIKTETNQEFKMTGTSSYVVATSNLMNNFAKNTYKDLSILLGCELITEEDISMREQMKMKYNQEMGMFRENSEKYEMPRLENIDILKFIGECESFVIDEHDSVFEGFPKKNEGMYQVCLKDAMAKYTEEKDRSKKATILTTELYQASQRLSKLRCLMGTINVGGASNLEKVANMDLVEDAVKASESAFYNGYNTGGSIAVVNAAKTLATTETDPINLVLYDIISEAFRNTLKDVVNNKYKIFDIETKTTIVPDNKKEYIDNLCDKMIADNRCISIIDNDDKEIINSSMTDIEILKATVSIISLLISSNQYVTISTQNS
ncbi:MAG: TCP-1/cpn60 chaperonin family protein [Herbinix sp.]|nr:TCP-1/cpn60 chaperonin family protein [Herbinix sp.]